ncbi:MAG: hypothetical protein C4519_01230 [Desulfobacteraceae bacterium]|nr:MAG: hypothetical protein C4519_01230 [Desulfobacteraceae bacterium]
MTVSERTKSPDFFEDHGPDPVAAATGGTYSAKSVPKKKAGFYLSEELIERFNRHFHRMKLAGTRIENKSALLELALLFALEDLDKGKESRLLQALEQKKNNGA